MTLNNAEWLSRKATRLFLSGYTQEQIANELNISVGSVNTIINKILNSDDLLDLQREVAIVAKDNKTSIKQLAANLRWKNRIKLMALEEKKTKFLDVMDSLFNKHGLSPTAGANLILSMIETILKKQIDPNRLEYEIKSKCAELQKINDQIESSKSTLQEAKVELEAKLSTINLKKKTLNIIMEICNVLDFYRAQF